MNVCQKIISKHLLSGQMLKGQEIALKIDQSLTQDATGTMTYLQFEAMNVIKVKTELSVSYVDHNTLSCGFENSDDHKFLQTCAKKFGVIFSPAGNGICHQVHLERFGAPGKTVIGSDSHTPTTGGLGMLAFGAGGLDVACAMAGKPFYITMPEIVKVHLINQLTGWASAKDIILELLRRLTVKGGRGKIFEFAGKACKTLSVTERATITNMATELGATTSIFASDEITKDFLEKQNRADAWTEILPDENSSYDNEIEIDLAQLKPLISMPHSPDLVRTVEEIEGIPVDQVCIGSCTNSSLADLTLAAQLAKGVKINENVSLVISPGSRQALSMLAQSRSLTDLIKCGARLLECACGPCIGMGQSPKSAGISVRTFNRSFEGRTGTKDAQVFLCSPAVAMAAAVKGEIIDPQKVFGAKPPEIVLPKKFFIDDTQFFAPAKSGQVVEIYRGPNIVSLPNFSGLGDTLSAQVSLKVGDNITTDHILPAGAKVLPYRSNLPKISEFTFGAVDADFVKRCKNIEAGIIVGGHNYGQGSSREHAALGPRYLGIRAVLVKSFARIHQANLINFGILPLTFIDESDYDKISLGSEIIFENIKDTIKNAKPLFAKVDGAAFEVRYDLSPRQKDLIFAGGVLSLIRGGK
ncbi:MAG: aconitate hydratase [Elusimicrobiota bacterium]|nr:aconitate hydratase [Elusimicrobiota bacterium]